MKFQHHITMNRVQITGCGLRQLARPRMAVGEQVNQVRTVYIPPGGRSILEKRLPRKLRVGDTRPPIYYKFDCKVELSDGSTVTRRSQFPKIEWRYLADNRNNPKWNPTRRNVKAVESDATGRLAKFKQKFGFVDEIDSSSAETKTEATAKKDLSDDYADLMGENVVPVQSGGRVATKKRSKGKKK